MLKEYLSLVGKPGQKVNPVFGYMGVEVVEISKERCRLHLPFRRDFIQGGGVVAGGIMAALADEAMAHAALAHLRDDQITATIEMNLRFLRPLKSGDLNAEARVVKAGKTIISLEADVADSDGEIIARAGATFMIKELGLKKR